MRSIALACVLVGCGGGGDVGNDSGVGGGDAGANAQDLATAAADLAQTADAASADLTTANGDGPQSGSYGSDGPNTVTTFTAQVTNGSSSFTEHIYLPSSAGPHPVVLIEPGLQQGASGYDSYGHRLATWGVLTLIRDDPGVLVNSSSVSGDLVYVATTWLPAQNADASSMLHGAVDVALVGLVGHSRGGQATLMAIEGGLAGKVKAWFGIDPVDNPQTGGAIQSLASIGIPSCFLGASVTTSCSPASENYDVLYKVAPSPSAEIVALNASHTQFEDQAGCVACAFCTPMGTAPNATVLDYSLRYLTAFFARELLGDASVGAAFQGAGAAADVAGGLVTITTK
jgi:hypothetical protein